jgi:DNA topoisomerase-1
LVALAAPEAPALAVVPPPAVAKAAGLRYVSDTSPGIRRRPAGERFTYIAPDGSTITDHETRVRIKSLAVPPAWTDVWICPRENGHIRATGRDARGRKQYRYHPKWRVVRDETKYERMLAFGAALPAIRARVEEDLSRSGLPREKVLAAVIQLLETTLIRVGNDEYAKANHSFGLTTMRDKHVAVNGSSLTFRFRGKSGKTHDVGIKDRRLARIVKRCRDLPGYELFQYLDEEGAPQTIGSADVNAYLREVSGEDFTAKDFRTWAGTVLAAVALQEFEAFDSEAQAKRNVVQAIESVAGRLGNTPSVCRKCYVHPAVIDGYLDGSMTEALKERIGQATASSSHDLPPEESAVLAWLRERLGSETPPSAR